MHAFWRTMLQEHKNPFTSCIIYLDFYFAIAICEIDLVNRFYLRK